MNIKLELLYNGMGIEKEDYEKIKTLITDEELFIYDNSIENDFIQKELEYTFDSLFDKDSKNYGENYKVIILKDKKDPIGFIYVKNYINEEELEDSYVYFTNIKLVEDYNTKDIYNEIMNKIYSILSNNLNFNLSKKKYIYNNENGISEEKKDLTEEEIKKKIAFIVDNNNLEEVLINLGGSVLKDLNNNKIIVMNNI